MYKKKKTEPNPTNSTVEPTVEPSDNHMIEFSEIVDRAFVTQKICENTFIWNEG